LLFRYDKAQFKRFLIVLVTTRDLPFLLHFLHGYLGFCTDPSNPHSPLPAAGASLTASGEKRGSARSWILSWGLSNAFNSARRDFLFLAEG